MLRVTNCRGLDDRVQLLVPHNSIHHSLPQSRSLLDGRRRQNLRRQQIGHTSMSIFSTCLRHSHWMPPLPTSRKYAPSVPARGCQSFWLPLVVIAGKRTNLQPVTFTCSHSQIIPQYIVTRSQFWPTSKQNYVLFTSALTVDICLSRCVHVMLHLTVPTQCLTCSTQWFCIYC